MRSWTQFQSDYASLTDDSTENATLGATYLNDSIRTVCNLQGGRLRFLESTVDLKTVAGRGTYEIPNKFRKVMDVYVTIGQGDPDDNSSRNTIYMPEMVFDPVRWKEILAYRLGTNDYPYFAYVQDQKFLFQPISASNDNTITVRGRLNTINLSIANYTDGSVTAVPKAVAFTAAILEGATSGTLTANWDLPTGDYTIFFDNGDQRIATFTNLSTAVTWTDATIADAGTAITVGTEEGGSIVTGSGTSWNDNMIGRYIKLANSGNPTGDGFWYEIADVISSTVLALVKPYTGTAFTGQIITYIIGQMSVIPEAYDIAPVYRAVALYWTDKGQPDKANKYWKLYDGGNEAGLIDTYGGVIGQMLANEGETEEGSYVPPFDRNSTIMQAPYYFPYQIATGFN